MNTNNSLILANLQNKIAILENAITQLIDMQTMLHLEIQVLKKQGGKSSTSGSKKTTEENDEEDDDLDISSIQNALRGTGSSGATLGRKLA
jgi:hypothetical protein